MELYKPYDYQRRAEQHIIDTPNCALFLGCGLGKSVITLSAIRRLIDWCDVTRVLVIAPKKVAEATWTDEAAKWSHTAGLRVSRVLGSVQQRQRALATQADVYVTCRDNFVWLCKHFNGVLPFDMCVLDELTSFKTPGSQRFKAFRRVRHQFGRIVGLTGTPAPNGLPDLWAQLYCIDGGKRLERTVTSYRQKYFTAVVWNNITIKLNLRTGAEAAIREAISDVCLSMRTEDYVSLPDCLTIDVPVTLPAKVLEQYRRFERDRVMQYQAAATDQTLVAESAAALMNKLAQWANGSVYDGEGAVVFVHNEKAERLQEIVDSVTTGGVLVFYQYRHDIPAILDVLKGRRVRQYKGEADLRAWNAGEVDVMLAHPASTAYGLNMQRGGHVIVWYGCGWDLELYEQANARLHRQGQSEPVRIYRLLATGTVDERTAKALEGKSNVQQTLLKALDATIRQYGNSK